MSAHHKGRHFASSVECEVKKGTLDLWVGSISIGEEYYETDGYRRKEDAIAELQGYISQTIHNLEGKYEKLREL